jgi:hypothetical protein
MYALVLDVSTLAIPYPSGLRQEHLTWGGNQVRRAAYSVRDLSYEHYAAWRLMRLSVTKEINRFILIKFKVSY